MLAPRKVKAAGYESRSKPNGVVVKAHHAMMGRPQTRATRATLHIRERWVADGRKTPLEVMLRNMEYFDHEVHQLLLKCGLWSAAPKNDAEKKERLQLLKAVANMRGLAQACAVDAAPYMHQKLNALTLDNKDGKPFRIVLETGEELL
jgi:hypothetical protein